jgi:hypothetical protein
LRRKHLARADCTKVRNDAEDAFGLWVCCSASKGEASLCWEVRELLEEGSCNPEFPSLVVLETMSGESGNADRGVCFVCAMI